MSQATHPYFTPSNPLKCGNTPPPFPMQKYTASPINVLLAILAARFNPITALIHAHVS